MRSTSNTELNLATELSNTREMVSKLSFDTQKYQKAESCGLELSTIRNAESTEKPQKNTVARKMQLTDWENLDPDVQMDVLPQPFRFLNESLHEKILAPVYNYIILKDNNPVHLELKQRKVPTVKLHREPNRDDCCLGMANYGDSDLYLSKGGSNEVFIERYERNEKTYKIVKKLAFKETVTRASVCGLEDFRYMEVFCFAVWFVTGCVDIYVYNTNNGVLERAARFEPESDGSVIGVSDCFSVITETALPKTRYYHLGLFDRLREAFIQTIRKAASNTGNATKSKVQETIVPHTFETRYFNEELGLSSLEPISADDIGDEYQGSVHFCFVFNRSSISFANSSVYLVAESAERRKIGLFHLESAENGLKFARIGEKTFSEPVHKLFVHNKIDKFIVSLDNGALLQVEIPSLLAVATVCEYSSPVEHLYFDSRQRSCLLVLKASFVFCSGKLEGFSREFKLAGYDAHTTKRYPLLASKVIRFAAHDPNTDLVFLLSNDGYVYKVNMAAQDIEGLYQVDTGSEGRFVQYSGLFAYKNKLFLAYRDTKEEASKLAVYSLLSDK